MDHIPRPPYSTPRSESSTVTGKDGDALLRHIPRRGRGAEMALTAWSQTFLGVRGSRRSPGGVWGSAPRIP